MNYTELSDNIRDELETGFTDNQILLFVQNTEKAIFNFVRVPTIRRTQLGQTTANVRFLTLPPDFVWPDNLVLLNPLGVRFPVEQRDYSFMREAYPNDLVTGQPKYYGQTDSDTFVLGPVPDSAYQVELTYGYYPESIVTAGNTWLGDNFGNVLLNGAITEGARFNKLEQDVINNYNEMYAQSLKLMKDVCEGRRLTDTYRSGEPRQPIA